MGQATNWSLCLAFVPAIASLTARYPVQGPRWPTALAAHLGADCLFAIVKLTMLVAIGEIAGAAGLPIMDGMNISFIEQLVALGALTCLAHLVSAVMRKAPAAFSREPLPEHFAVRDPDGFRMVRPQEIIWADAQGNYARLHTASGRHLIRSTMTSLEKMLDAGSFVRIHRRLIVNAGQIERIDRHGNGIFRLHLADGSELRSARSYHDRVSRLLG